MIIRPVVSREYTALPNSILQDARLSADTRAMVALLLSKPKGWELRPRPLAKLLSRKGGKPIGRKRLTRMFREAAAAGYMARSEEQSHQDDGSFGRYVYFVGLPDDVAEAIETTGVAILPQFPNAHTPDAHTPQGTTIHKEQILETTEPTKPESRKATADSDSGSTVCGASNGQASRAARPEGQEVVQHRLAERLGRGDTERGFLTLLELDPNRRDELTAMERAGRLSDDLIERLLR